MSKCANAKAVLSLSCVIYARHRVSNCIRSNNNYYWKAKSSADIILTPSLTLPSLFDTVQQSHFVFRAGHTFTHTYQRPVQPYINSNLFHLRLDADDRLIRRTNSIIMNNPRSWQPHKKSLDEWVVYLLQCM